MKKREEGFSLIELLMVMFLASILVSLGAFALRHYWFVQALEGGASDVVTQMREAQQSAMAESHPVVYGVRLLPESSDWGVVQFDPRKATNKCKSAGDFEFDGGVEVESVAPAFAGGNEARDACVSAFPNNRFAFFFARGTATAGAVTLTSTQLDRSKTIEVLGITGRVIEP